VTPLAGKCNSLIALVFLLIYGVCLYQLEIDRKEVKLEEKESGIWNLPPLLLMTAAGEFKGIMASMITLEAGARTGTRVERSGDGFESKEPEINCQSVYKMLAASQTLDPSFQQTFIIANSFLPWDCQMVNENIKFLETAKKARPNDWMPISLLAFNHYYFLDDYATAGAIYLQAAQDMENPLPYFSILGARLIKKGGQSENGAMMLKSVLAGMQPDEPGFGDIQKRLQALQATLVLEKAVFRYREKIGFWPEKPEQLLTSGILKKLPENSYDFSFCINSEGAVFFDRPDCRSAQ